MDKKNIFMSAWGVSCATVALLTCMALRRRKRQEVSSECNADQVPDLGDKLNNNRASQKEMEEMKEMKEKEIPKPTQRAVKVDTNPQDAFAEEMIKIAIFWAVSATRDEDNVQLLINVSQAAGVLKALREIVSLKGLGRSTIPTKIGDAEDFLAGLVHQQHSTSTFIRSEVFKDTGTARAPRSESKKKENSQKENIEAHTLSGRTRININRLSEATKR